MKLSELIEELTGVMDDEGDLEVKMVVDYRSGRNHPLASIEVDMEGPCVDLLPDFN